MLLIDQGSEGDEVERAVGRNQQVARIARHIAQESPHRLHQKLIHGARESFDVGPVRVAQRFAPGLYRLIDRSRFAEVYPVGLALRRQQIGEVARRFGLFGLRIERREVGELDQGAVSGESGLNCGSVTGRPWLQRSLNWSLRELSSASNFSTFSLSESRLFR